jgi:hypothetical protein
MVGDAPVQQMSYIAGQDFSSTGLFTPNTAQFRAVMMGTDGKMYIASTSAQTIGAVTVPANQAWGILQNDPTAGDIATVTELGHSKAYMGTTANPGQGLKVYDTNGTLGPGISGTDVIVGMMSQDICGGAGEIHDIALIAHQPQGTNYHAGQLMFGIKQTNLTASGNVYASIPLGFTGSIVGVYGIYTTAAGTSSGVGTLDFKLYTGGSGRQVQSAGPATVTLTLSNSDTVGTVVSQSAAPTLNNSFAPTDTLTIHYTQTTTFLSDTGVLEVHIITN